MRAVEEIIQENVSAEKDMVNKYYPSMSDEDKKEYVALYERLLTNKIFGILEETPGEEGKIWSHVVLHGEYLRGDALYEYLQDFHITFEQLCDIYLDILESNNIDDKLGRFIVEKEKSQIQSLYESKYIKRERSYSGCYAVVDNELVGRALSNIEHYQEEFLKLG